MKLVKVITPDNKKRYMLLNNAGAPVEPVLRYLKFKDYAGNARNSLRAYGYHLKHYFKFLEQKGLDYRDVSIDEMAEFMRWLHQPDANIKVIRMQPKDNSKKASTVNTVLNTVMNFYDYLMRHEDFSIQVSERLKKTLSGSKRGFKDFLYHINRNKQFSAIILKLKTEKKRPKTLSKDQIETIIGACNNLRDKFLIRLLWEGGLRIGEALALWLEDVEIDSGKVHIRDRGELSNGAEIKTICSPRTIDVSSDLMNLYINYVSEYHTEDVDTNHVFINISGDHKYGPMGYKAVESLILRLQKKTGVDFTPHVLRHTSIDSLRRAGMKDEMLSKRAGHKNVQTTIQIYSHPQDEDVRKEWERIESIKNSKDIQEELTVKGPF